MFLTSPIERERVQQKGKIKFRIYMYTQRNTKPQRTARGEVGKAGGMGVYD